MQKYSRPEMQVIWENENKFKNWLEIEMLICEALEELGEIPEGITKKIRAKAGFDIKRIDQIEIDMRHNVVAFLANLSEYLGDDAKYLHRGVTSSDIQDTGLSLQLMQASDILIEGIERVMQLLSAKALEYKTALCVGRSHGIHAEPTTFGMKMLNHYLAFKRAHERMINAKKEISVCSLSGNMGTFSNINSKVETYVAKHLNMQQGSVGTQVIARDRHAMFFATITVIASSIENLALEFRSLQRTEIDEVEEPFDIWEKGSTAMPHKHNPIMAENLMGIARIIRATISPVLENIAAWHESDLSHTSVEAVMAPCATNYLDFALHRLGDLIEGMKVSHEKMIKNLEMSRGLVFLQQILLELIKGGMSREYAYSLVHELSEQVYESKNLNLSDIVKKDETVLEYVDREKITSIFDYSRSLTRISEIIDGYLLHNESESISA